MAKRSAGLLMYRRSKGCLEVFLVHPGGPFWANKDLAAWSIPKGEYESAEYALDAAKREFHEETGLVPQGAFIEIGSIKQSGGKLVTAWAVEGDFDPSHLVSNTCSIEWPPGSGRWNEFPEVDRGSWFSISDARERILKMQQSFLDRLSDALGG